MTEIIFLVEEDPEGRYVARAIGESIFTQGESLSELREMVRDAVHCHFEDEQRPKLIRLHIVRDEVIAIPHPSSLIPHPFAISSSIG